MTREICQKNIVAPWTVPSLQHLDAVTLEEWMETEFAKPEYTLFKPYVSEMLRMFTNTILSNSPRHMSALYFFWYLARCGGFRDLTDGGVKNGPDSLRIEEGYGHVVERIRDEILARGDSVEIKLNQKVASFAIESDKAVIKTADGETFTAAKCIVAVPPFALRRASFDFDLLGRDEIHNKMRPGRMFKGYARYKTAWWKEFGGIAAEGEQDMVTRGQMTSLYDQEAVSDKSRDEYTGHSGYTNGTHHPVVWTMPATWRHNDKDYNPGLPLLRRRRVLRQMEGRRSEPGPATREGPRHHQ